MRGKIERVRHLNTLQSQNEDGCIRVGEWRKENISWSKMTHSEERATGEGLVPKFRLRMITVPWRTGVEGFFCMLCFYLDLILLRLHASYRREKWLLTLWLEKLIQFYKCSPRTSCSMAARSGLVSSKASAQTIQGERFAQPPWTSTSCLNTENHLLQNIPNFALCCVHLTALWSAFPPILSFFFSRRYVII